MNFNGYSYITAVHGGWSDWTGWSDCDNSNNNNQWTKERTRNCTNPEPAHDGHDCPETDEKFGQETCPPSIKIGIIHDDIC